MRGKGKQFVPHGRRVMMAFPGGAGYGDPKTARSATWCNAIWRAAISAEAAARDYGMDAS